MRLIDADKLKNVKFHPLPYTHITPTDADAESYKRGWNDAIDAIVLDAPTIEPEDKCCECDAWNKYKNYSQHWISVMERLPEMDDRVLVYTTGHEYHVWDAMPNRGENYAWEDEEGLYHNLYEADLWFPLPEPYEEQV